MPPRRVPVPVPPDDQEFVEVSEGTETVMELLDRLGDKAEAVILNEWNAQTRKREYLETIPTEQFTLDYVRSGWGAGTFVALLTDERNRIIGSRGFTVGARRKIGEEAPSPDGQPAAKPGLDPQVIVQQAQIETLKAFAQSQGEMMRGLFGMLAGKKDEVKLPDPIAMIDKLASTMRALTPPAVAPAAAPADPKMWGEMFREGLEVGKLAAAPEESGLGEITRTLIPPVVRALDSAVQRERGGAAPLALPAPGAKVEVNFQVAPWLMHLTPFFPEIATWAKQGWDAEAYVGSLVARLPDAVLDEIEQASRDPNFAVTAVGALPLPFQAHRVWITQALEALKTAVTEPPETPGGEEEKEDA